MTRTGTIARRIIAAASAVTALALIAGLAPVTASATTESAPVAAAAKVKKAKKAKKPAAVPATARAAATVASATDFTSIFTTQQPAFANAGWAACPAAITWTVDTTGLGAAEAARQIENLRASFDQWAAASGLSFQYAGTADFAYNESAFTLTPAGGTTAATRAIRLAFVDDADSDLLGGQTVGMAGPTTVWASDKVIESGTGVFRTDAVKRMSDTQARALFTHELGHVLGLGHAAETGNIMYPVVSTATALGAGDVAGVQTMTKPCAA